MSQEDLPERPWPLGQPENVLPPPESMRARGRRLLDLMERIPELQMRVALLAESLAEVTREEGATLLAELLRGAHGHEAGRRLRIALALALSSEALREAGVLDGIQQEAEARHDVAVGNLLRSRGPYRSVRKEHLPKPPPGSPSRELSLGERRALARRPERHTLERLMVDPDPLVIGNLLRNPRLTEDDVVRLASRRPCPSEVLAEIARSRRWILRRRVLMALVLNPYNRTDIALRLLESLPGDALREVAREPSIDPLLREAAAALRGDAS